MRLISEQIGSLSAVYPGYSCGAWDNEDIEQDLLIARWQNQRRCRKLLVLDYLRRFSPNRTARIPGTGRPYVPASAQHREPDPVMQTEVKDSVWWLLGKLSARLRWVLISFYFDNKRLADIALEMGVSTSRVCQIKQDALRKLRLEGM